MKKKKTSEKKQSFKENWKIFIDSFRLNSSFLYILFYDLFFYGIMVPLFTLFSFLAKKKHSAIDQDILSMVDPSSISGATAAQTQQLQLAMQSMQSFFYTVIIGMALLILVGLFTFTLTRTLIWNHLLKKRFDTKKYLKLNLLILLMTLFTAILYILIRIISPFVIDPLTRISFSFGLIIAAVLFLLIFIAAIYFASLVYINYTKKPEVFSSIGKTFSLIKTQFQKIYISYLFIFIFTFIVSLVAMIRWLLPVAMQSYFNYAIVLLTLAWIRTYIIKIIK